MGKRVVEATPQGTIIPLYDHDADEVLAGARVEGHYITKANLDKWLNRGLSERKVSDSKRLMAEIDKMRRRGEIVDVTDYTDLRHAKEAFLKKPSDDLATAYEKRAKAIIIAAHKIYDPKKPRGGNVYALSKRHKDFYLGLVDKQVAAMKEGKSKTEVNRLVRKTLEDWVTGYKAETQKIESGSPISRAQADRSELARDSDARQLHSLVVEDNDPRVKRWIDDPGLMDIRGVDTPSHNKKRTRKAKPRRRHKSVGNPTGLLSLRR